MSKGHTTTLSVSGMNCHSCIRHVDSALKELEGVSKVDVRLREGKVVVEHDEADTPVSALISAITDAGYEAHA